MRELKFKLVDNNNIVIGPYTIKEIYEIGDALNFDNCKWIQYTGLLDKNGKEIYEGDILESTNPKEILVRFLVQWGYRDNPYSWGLKSITTPGASYEFCDHKESMQVVGNIYSNPELLTTAS